MIEIDKTGLILLLVLVFTAGFLVSTGVTLVARLRYIQQGLNKLAQKLKGADNDSD